MKKIALALWTLSANLFANPLELESTSSRSNQAVLWEAFNQFHMDEMNAELQTGYIKKGANPGELIASSANGSISCKSNQLVHLPVQTYSCDFSNAKNLFTTSNNLAMILFEVLENLNKTYEQTGASAHSPIVYENSSELHIEDNKARLTCTSNSLINLPVQEYRCELKENKIDIDQIFTELVNNQKNPRAIALKHMLDSLEKSGWLRKGMYNESNRLIFDLCLPDNSQTGCSQTLQVKGSYMDLNELGRVLMSFEVNSVSTSEPIGSVVFGNRNVIEE